MKMVFLVCLYPKKGKTDASGYNICKYKPVEEIKTPDGMTVYSDITCRGTFLPQRRGVVYDMQGRWEKNDYGYQLIVDNYEETIVPEKQSIINYLSGGQIRGIGKKTALMIYNKFGLQSLEILDKNPERLLEINGLGEKKAKKIIDSYLAQRGARDVVTYLIPFGVKSSKSIKLFTKYGSDALTFVQKNPYKVCADGILSFPVVDEIAKRHGYDRRAPERIERAMVYVLQCGEQCGHTGMTGSDIVRKVRKLLTDDGITEDEIKAAGKRLIETDELCFLKNIAYLKKNAVAENRLALNLLMHMRNQGVVIKDFDDTLDNIEREYIGFHLSDEQRLAVKTALSNPVTVVTGGPGTGKTAIQKAMLKMFCRYNPNKQMTCCAPTGKAARRMTEATGYTSSTIHRALGLLADENGEFSEPQTLPGDFIIVDEISMLDSLLADALFRSIKPTAQIVLVGDVNQLASVGAGNVLKDIIDSGSIPIVRLEKVFRQKGDSSIAINAAKIKNGEKTLELGDDFQFIKSGSIDESVEIVASLYKQEVDELGLDNVAVLLPLRRNTNLSVENVNRRLQSIVNPPKPGKQEITVRNYVFREGDKVMQTKNFEDVSNGDIGYIVSITSDEGDMIVKIDFGDDRIKEYDLTQIDMVELGYALTIHKSQGSEYKSVIMAFHTQFGDNMLCRPLIYTGITRGKKKVFIVGDKKAVVQSIDNANVGTRTTGLKQRLQMSVIQLMVEGGPKRYAERTQNSGN